MRKIYKNPKELGTCLKDLVDFYLDDVIEYNKLKEKIIILANANEDKLSKEGSIPIKISNILGESRVAIIKKILSEKQN
ncbi:TIGR04540 family protein [Clostridium estertheticum]|uniref:TIGR04540 family protein n=1 Tax=Clostridium estertheticum TaxID=238834 RepID=A0A7Y3SWE3_9CLOT|nr:TIGR04540 family protein [Clostridium estertheticum]MBW9171162.1 TIGR04540 family protein [Clostridium estertheticum]MBX4259842.1 TIGR04540 family protein [Clostridium estertheticum]MBX4266252.1 TIGR04540 family protein [Clostridium estertheticum]MBX4268854.1 TIGR04540 family protein [Clostridium estertheticum]MCB2342995.1 TIGR04540 family protein [Clostridium estertheticum]